MSAPSRFRFCMTGVTRWGRSWHLHLPRSGRIHHMMCEAHDPHHASRCLDCPACVKEAIDENERRRP